MDLRGIFCLIMGSELTQHLEFGKLLICSSNSCLESQQRLVNRHAIHTLSILAG